MKKILFIATTVSLLLASCSNDEVIGTGTNNENASEISFRTLIDKDTRASITDGTNLTSLTLTAWWDKSGTPDYGNTSTGTSLFDAYTLARGEGPIYWDYDPKNYWPAKGKGTVDFFAYSPASSVNVGTGIKGYTGAPITYTVPKINNLKNDVDLQEDFLVAKAVNLTEDKVNAAPGNGYVKLNFKHALSRVKFFARKKNPDINYVIGKVELVNLFSEAKLSFGDIPDGETTVSYTGTTTLWTGQATKVDYTADMGESPIALPYNTNKKDEFYSLLGGISAIMVMPQTTTLLTEPDPETKDEFAVAISYKAHIDDYYYAGNKEGSSNEWKTKYIAVKDLKGAAGKGITFEFGKQYNFFFELGDEVGDAISFSVATSPWTDAAPEYLPEPSDYTAYILTFLKDGVTITPKLPIDGTKAITKADLLSVTGIKVERDANPMDFTGIEYFENLETLELDGVKNEVGLVNLDASKNAKLKEARFYGSSILGTVNLSNTALTTIMCGTPTFVNLNLSNTKLTRFGDKSLIKLSAATVTGTLDLSGCGLTKIDEMPTAIPAVLNLSNNKIAGTYDLSSASTVTRTSLNLSNNKITELEVGNIIYSNINISNNPTLTKLTLDKINVTGELNASGNTALTEIQLGTGHEKNDYSIALLDISDSKNLGKDKLNVHSGYGINTLILWNSCTQSDYEYFKNIHTGNTGEGYPNAYITTVKRKDGSSISTPPTP